MRFRLTRAQIRAPRSVSPLQPHPARRGPRNQRGAQKQPRRRFVLALKTYKFPPSRGLVLLERLRMSQTFIRSAFPSQDFFCVTLRCFKTRYKIILAGKNSYTRH